MFDPIFIACIYAFKFHSVSMTWTRILTPAIFPVIKGPGSAAPTGTDNKGPGLSGLLSKATLGLSKHIPSKGVRTPAAASRSPEAPDTLMGMLQNPSILEEHHTLMGMVVERILSARSGLNEAFTGLLRGFEVCNVIS